MMRMFVIAQGTTESRCAVYFDVFDDRIDGFEGFPAVYAFERSRRFARVDARQQMHLEKRRRNATRLAFEAYKQLLARQTSFIFVVIRGNVKIHVRFDVN